MSRLNLTTFKELVNEKEQKNLKKLTAGIIGAENIADVVITAVEKPKPIGIPAPIDPPDDE